MAEPKQNDIDRWKVWFHHTGLTQAVSEAQLTDVAVINSSVVYRFAGDSGTAAEVAENIDSLSVISGTPYLTVELAADGFTIIEPLQPQAA